MSISQDNGAQQQQEFVHPQAENDANDRLSNDGLYTEFDVDFDEEPTTLVVTNNKRSNALQTADNDDDLFDPSGEARAAASVESELPPLPHPGFGSQQSMDALTAFASVSPSVPMPSAPMPTTASEADLFVVENQGQGKKQPPPPLSPPTTVASATAAPEPSSALVPFVAADGAAFHPPSSGRGEEGQILRQKHGRGGGVSAAASEGYQMERMIQKRILMERNMARHDAKIIHEVRSSFAEHMARKQQRLIQHLQQQQQAVANNNNTASAMARSGTMGSMENSGLFAASTPLGGPPPQGMANQRGDNTNTNNNNSLIALMGQSQQLFAESCRLESLTSPHSITIKSASDRTSRGARFLLGLGDQLDKWEKEQERWEEEEERLEKDQERQKQALCMEEMMVEMRNTFPSFQQFHDARRVARDDPFRFPEPYQSLLLKDRIETLKRKRASDFLSRIEALAESERDADLSNLELLGQATSHSAREFFRSRVNVEDSSESSSSSSSSSGSSETSATNNAATAGVQKGDSARRGGKGSDSDLSDDLTDATGVTPSSASKSSDDSSDDTTSTSRTSDTASACSSDLADGLPHFPGELAPLIRKDRPRTLPLVFRVSFSTVYRSTLISTFGNTETSAGVGGAQGRRIRAAGLQVTNRSSNAAAADDYDDLYDDDDRQSRQFRAHRVFRSGGGGNSGGTGLSGTVGKRGGGGLPTLAGPTASTSERMGEAAKVFLHNYATEPAKQMSSWARSHAPSASSLFPSRQRVKDFAARALSNFGAGGSAIITNYHHHDRDYYDREEREHGDSTYRKLLRRWDEEGGSKSSSSTWRKRGKKKDENNNNSDCGASSGSASGSSSSSSDDSDPDEATIAERKRYLLGRCNAYFLDDPRIVGERMRKVIKLPSYRCSVIGFADAETVKRDIDQQFFLQHPFCEALGLKLTTIRHAKTLLLQFAFEEGSPIDVATIAYAVCYFERMILREYVDRDNRHLMVSCCLLLAMKYAETGITDEGAMSRKIRFIRDKVEEVFGVEWSDVIAAEFKVFVALRFDLYVPEDVGLTYYVQLLAMKNLTPNEHLQ